MHRPWKYKAGDGLERTRYNKRTYLQIIEYYVVLDRITRLNGHKLTPGYTVVGVYDDDFMDYWIPAREIDNPRNYSIRWEVWRRVSRS